MPNDRKRISVNSQLHAEITSSFPGSHRTHRKLLPRRTAIVRLFLVIGLNTSNMQCLYAAALMAAPGYAWVPPTAGSLNSLGTITLMGSNQGSSVPLLSPSIHGKSGPLACNDAHWNDFGKQLKITYAMGHALVHVTVTIMVNGAAFEAMVDAAVGNTPLIVPLAEGTYWRLPLTGAKSYSWPVTRKNE